jgi:two-component flavin-dependent monooxygenase
MRGTGSDTLVVDSVFVPEEHSFAAADLLAGRAPGTAPLPLAVRLQDVSALTFAAPVLGAARGALETWARAAARRKPSAEADAAFAYCAAQIDAAALLLGRAAREADRGGQRDERAGAAAQRDQVYAVELLLGAVNRLVREGGTSGMDEDADLQRFWRDATTGATHAVLKWAPAARRYAAAALPRG